jgi:hypothetical protein
MPSVVEIATAAGAMATVVGISVAATVYFAEGSDLEPSFDPAVSGPHRYVISDAYYLCRDHIDSAVPYQVRNIHVDSHSSRYDENRNDNLVFIDLELVERVGETLGSARNAQIVCRVSAASNEISSFQVNKG